MDRRLILAFATGLALAGAASSCARDTEPTEPEEPAEVDQSRLSREGGDAFEPPGAEPKTLYVWAGDAARRAPDFLAVIDFNRRSRNYGKVLRTVPIPPPGNIGNEPQHCHTSMDRKLLACRGLLSVLKGQDDIFFFDISSARHPKFLFSTRAPNSSVTDAFLPLPEGGFLVTNMGSATGGAGGRVVEFDANLRLVGEYPTTPPADGTFNPHGIDADFSKNLLVTSDYVNPVTTLNVWTGEIELRSAVRFWDLRGRRIVRTVFLPDQAGTMDVKLIPGDPHARAITANMFTGLVYTVDPTDGSWVRPNRSIMTVPRHASDLETSQTQTGEVVKAAVVGRLRSEDQTILRLRGEPYDGKRESLKRRMTFGNSFVSGVEFTVAGPVARSILAYGTSARPESPQYDDQARLFARGGMKPVWFEMDEILAHLEEHYHLGERPTGR